NKLNNYIINETKLLNEKEKQILPSVSNNVNNSTNNSLNNNNLSIERLQLKLSLAKLIEKIAYDLCKDGYCFIGFPYWKEAQIESVETDKTIYKYSSNNNNNEPIINKKSQNEYYEFNKVSNNLKNHYFFQ